MFTYHILTPTCDLLVELPQVVLASLMALGSRRSNHSGIVGVAGGRLVAQGLELSLQDVDTALGVKREATCRALAERAVDLARNCKLLRDFSPAAVEAAAVLRVALFGPFSFDDLLAKVSLKLLPFVYLAVSPRHPYSSELAAHLHATQIANFRRSTNDFGTDQFGLSVVEYDSYTAVLRRVPPQISEAELSFVCELSLNFRAESFLLTRFDSKMDGDATRSQTHWSI